MQQPPESVVRRDPSDVFAERVQRARKAAGMSQRDLASELEKLGRSIDASAITRIERGERSVKVDEAVDIAQALRTTVSSLLAEESRPTLEFLRSRANYSMHEARRAIAGMLSDMAMIQADLREDPRRMSLFADEKEAPESAEEYLNWVRGRLQHIARDWAVAPAQTTEDAVALRKIASSLIGHLVVLDPEVFDWDDELDG